MTHAREVLEYLKPFILTAGDYSAQIQDRIGLQKQKGGATPFHQALSDADLTVQSYVEVALLARFPDVSFFSEEQDQSLNVKYFPKDRPLEVMLDPIDGTRAYIDGRAAYQIIVTCHDEAEIVGALIHRPRMGFTYLALKGEGVRRWSNSHDLLSTGGESWALPSEIHPNAPLLVFNAPQLVEGISADHPIVDLVPAYEDASVTLDSLDVFTGRASGILLTPCQAIDGGAIAFMIKEGGGVISSFDGGAIPSYRTSEKRVAPHVFAAANTRVHQAVLPTLKNWLQGAS